MRSRPAVVAGEAARGVRAQELVGEFEVEGHHLRLSTRYWRRPAMPSGLLERWRARVGDADFFHVQQTGARPTFLGVRCADEALGRQFTLELLCGGWGWHSLRRQNLLFSVGEVSVRACEGLHCRPAIELAELAASHVLPRARERVRQQEADRRQHLDDVLRRDWGEHVRILRYDWSPGRGLYCEHGHFAVPECHGNRFGRAVGVAAGLAKRLGLHRIEHWFEERLGGWLRAIHPFDVLRQLRQFAERQLAVATALSRLGGSTRRPTIVCSHTHEVAAVSTGPVHAFLHAATGATYANTGAWSSRFRLKRSGDTRVEWLEVSATNRVRPRLAAIA